MLKPICVPCQRFFKVKKNGFYFIEGMPAPGIRHAVPGTEAPEQWKPYKMWAGDLYECDGCGAQIVSGAGLHPIAEHYQPDFAEQVEKFDAELQVNDC